MTGKGRVFEFARLVEQLRKLKHSQRLLFSLLCSERLLPGYRQFERIAGWGDSLLLEKCIELGYGVVLGDDAPFDIQKHLDRCDAVIPDSEDFQDPLVAYAQNCGISVAYSLDVVKNDKAEDAAYSALKVVETTDAHLVRILGFGRGRFDSFDQSIVDGHELMQRELSKQESDLEKMENLDVLDLSIVSLLRSENREYAIPFEQ